MIIGPKYKIARRLGAPIFEKTQTQKFKARQTDEKPKRRSQTDYGRQMNEKQKARFTYGISENQFANYVKKVIDSKVTKPHEKLFELLESRLDNVIYKAGLASTRRFARQLVSHGHIKVNGRKMNIPSFAVSQGDVITIREGSQSKPVFAAVEEKVGSMTLPMWMVFDAKKKEWKVQSLPKMDGERLLFNLEEVLQFYKRS